MADHAALRASIRQQLLGLGVTQEVHQALLKVQGGGAVTTEKVMLLLQESGLVAQLAGKIGPPSGVMASLANAQSSSGEVEAVRPSASKRQLLHIKVVDARAFVDYVARDAAPGEQLVLHGDLFGQRFSSRAAPACAEPQLRAEEYIELPAEGGGQPQAGGSGAGSGAGAGAGAGAAAGGGGAGALLALLPHAQPLHLAVVRTLPPPPAPPDDGGGGSMAGAAAANGGGGGGAGAAGAAPPKFGGGGDGGAAAATLAARSVAALGAAEWRTVLVRKRQVMISVQLSSGPAALAAGLPASPAGVVVLQLSLVPNSGACLDEALLHSQQRSEHARDADAMARFLGRARAWWGEFTALRPDFRTRPVKVLARCEDGAQYPACTFVAPLQLGRAVATPRQAHRFVSLLRPRELSDEDLRGGGGGGMGMAGDGGGGGGVWCLLPTVLASGSASKEEAALLLCGMLLGFGLDAWVVLGRSRNGTGHAWVLTRGPLAVPTFWEPLTGMRYGPDDAPTWPYLSVGCCFNHSVVVANCQDGDAAPGVSFLFEDPLRWRTLEVPRNDVPAPHWVPLELFPPRHDAAALETTLESALMARLSGARAGAVPGVGPAVWDASLGHLLMPALEAYEHEAVTGEPAPGNDEFQQGVKRAVPLGWLFKGFPLHQRHLGDEQAAAALLAEPQVQDILSTTAPGATFALRVRVTPYPEGLFSVWMMLAVKFQGGRA